MSDTDTDDLLVLTAQIVSAHVRKNQVPAEGLTNLICSVHAALVGATDPVPAAPERPQPAVPIKRSVFPDHIVCLEDGKQLTVLTRYLARAHGMTPDQYRHRWGLPSDYPMVAPNYAERRSAHARSMGLGRRPGEASAAPGVQRVPEGRSGTRKKKQSAEPAVLP